MNLSSIFIPKASTRKLISLGSVNDSILTFVTQVWTGKHMLCIDGKNTCYRVIVRNIKYEMSSSVLHRNPLK